MSRGKRVLRILVIAAATLAAGYALICLLVYLFQARLVYMPKQEIEATPADIDLPYEDVSFQARDGTRLTGWLVPADPARGTVLFCHGNAGNVSHRLDTLRILHHLRVNTLIFDYRGYGESEGTPSEEGTYRDAEAAWQWLVGDRGIDRARIVVFGRSLGGGVASWLAVEQEPPGLILESTFTSLPDVGARVYPFLPVRLLARIHYPTVERLPLVACPILVAHSPDDELIPYAHGRRLYEVASEPKHFLELDGDHNDGYLLTGQPYLDGLDRFLTRCLGE
ncbi:MAG: alpha/beta hydrolase [Planctomycetota bacterium]